MGPTLSAKEIKKQVKELYEKIGSCQSCIKSEFRNFKKAAKVYGSATEAYKKALSLTDEDSALIVTVSFYLVSDIRNMLSR